MQINQTMTPTQIAEPARFDRRIVRTQNLLAHALIELTLEHGYEAITIREITERAKVGYATFFRHYSDKEALLNDVLALFIEELTQRLSSSVGEPQSGRGDESDSTQSALFVASPEQNSGHRHNSCGGCTLSLERGNDFADRMVAGKRDAPLPTTHGRDLPGFDCTSYCKSNDGCVLNSGQNMPGTGVKKLCQSDTVSPVPGM